MKKIKLSHFLYNITQNPNNFFPKIKKFIPATIQRD